MIGHDMRMPTGGDAWQTSRILLPESLSGRTFRDVVSGTNVRPVATDKVSWLFVGQLFSSLPVAVLRAEPDNTMSIQVDG